MTDRETENAAFLVALEETGNVLIAASRVGRHHMTFIKRRQAGDAMLEEGWERALDIAHRRLARRADPPGEEGLRTRGGELYVAQGRDGRRQLRRARKGQLTRKALDSFLAHLAGTAHVGLAAERTGVTLSAFHQRAAIDPIFRAEWKDAMEMGYTRLEQQALAAAQAGLEAPGLPISGADDLEEASEAAQSWLDRAEAMPLEPWTPAQALQLLALHRAPVRHALPAMRNRKPRVVRSTLEHATERLEKIMRGMKLLPDPLDDECEITRPA